MVRTIVTVMEILSQVIFILVLAKIILSYFMDPFHPIRRTIDQIVEPMLAPIRSVIPPVGRFDFSPIILIIIIEVLVSVLRSVLL